MAPSPHALLALARATDAEIEAAERDPAPEIRLLARSERRHRRGRGPVAARVRLADRLLEAPGPLDEEALQALVDEASFGDHPQDLVWPWLGAELLARARAGLGAAYALLAPPPEVPDALMASATAFLGALQADEGARLPDDLDSAPLEALGAALERALAEQPPRALRTLARAVAARGEARIVVPVLCAALTLPWEHRHSRRPLIRGLRGSPVAAWVSVALLLDGSVRQVPRGELLASAPRFSGAEVAAAVWCSLWSSSDRHAADDHWSALGDLGEPAALTDAMAHWGRSGMSLLDLPIPERPSALRGLLRIVCRKDPRLDELGRRPRDPEGDLFARTPPEAVWAHAVWLVPEVAHRWDAVPEARQALARELERAVAGGAPAEDVHRLAVAAGRLGEPAALPVLLGALERRVGYDTALALAALGEAARAAVPRLVADDGEWSWVALAGIEPASPRWAARLAEHLTAPDRIGDAATAAEHYREGLITLGEVAAKLALLTDAARIWRARTEAHGPEPELSRAASALLATLPAGGTFPLPELEADLRAVATSRPGA